MGFGFDYLRALGRCRCDSHVRSIVFTMWTYADKDTGECFPALDTIAAATGQNRATVVRAIDAAVRAGLIERVGTFRRATKYRLSQPPAIVQPVASAQHVASTQQVASTRNDPVASTRHDPVASTQHNQNMYQPIDQPNSLTQPQPAAPVSVATAPTAPPPQAEPKKAEQLKLLAKESTPKPAKKPKSATNPYADADNLRGIWNHCAERVAMWNHCSKTDGACIRNLPQALRTIRESIPVKPNDEQGIDGPVWDLLDFAAADGYYNGTKLDRSWGILDFFSHHNTDRLIADFQRSQERRP